MIDGLFEPSLEQMLVTFERDEGALIGGGRRFPQRFRQMEAMDGVEKEQGADPLIEILAPPTEGVQLIALLEQFTGRKPGTGALE